MIQTSGTGTSGKRSRLPLIAAIVAGVLLIVGIRYVTTRDDAPAAADAAAPGTAAPPPRDGCTTVHVAASSEKAALMGQIANSYRESGRTVNGKCYDITVTSAASGTAEANLAAGWDETRERPGSGRLDTRGVDLGEPAEKRPDRERPTEHRRGPSHLRLGGLHPVGVGDARNRWPLRWAGRTTPIGWSDVLTLARDPQGWAAKGHPEWGRFTLGKTNPNVSTSGLAATIGTLVAATGTSSDLTAAALQQPDVQQYLKDVETSVIHYGDTTLTYLENLQRADDAGAALGYLSAVAVEEKSVLDYDAGNPSGDPATLGRHAPPKVPLVAVYPKEGTLSSDSPYVILDASWSTADKRAGAQDFLAYLQLPEQQKVFTDSFFRTADGAPGDPINASTLRERGRCQDRVEPAGRRCAPRRAGAVGGGPQERPGAAGDGRVRVDERGLRFRRQVEARAGQVGRRDRARAAGGHRSGRVLDLHHRAPDTDRRSPGSGSTSGPSRQTRQQITDAIAGLTPLGGTPLYAATRLAAEWMNAHADPASINAVVVLTDGRNDHTDNDLDGLISQLSDSAREHGVRVFTIGYGPDADMETLQKISQASLAAAYDARDPATIDKVFADVLSNF